MDAKPPHEITSRYTPTEAERKLILGTMRGWLNGDPVWPYDQILSEWGDVFENDRRRWMREMANGGFDPEAFEKRAERESRLHALRWEAVTEFGFAIPCAELMDALRAAQPVVEIGAGSGYLTALARSSGIDIVGTEPAIETFAFDVGRYDPRRLPIEGKTAVRRFADRTVFCAWPSLNKTWFRQALKAMHRGQRLIVIREDACAEESAWEYLDASFQFEADINIPTWPHLYDYGVVCRKR